MKQIPKDLAQILQTAGGSAISQDALHGLLRSSDATGVDAASKRRWRRKFAGCCGYGKAK